MTLCCYGWEMGIFLRKYRNRELHHPKNVLVHVIQHQALHPFNSI